MFCKWYLINGIRKMVFDKVYLTKSISAVTNYNSSSCLLINQWIKCFWNGSRAVKPLLLIIVMAVFIFDEYFTNMFILILDGTCLMMKLLHCQSGLNQARLIWVNYIYHYWQIMIRMWMIMVQSQSVNVPMVSIGVRHKYFTHDESKFWGRFYSQSKTK